MILSTQGIVLHTTPYGEASVIVRVFTRALGVKTYMVKGVRGRGGRVKQNLLQPLSCLDMAVYDSPRADINHIKELSPLHAAAEPGPVANALRFFMAEVLYKSLPEAEPAPALWDYVEEMACMETSGGPVGTGHLPIVFMLTVARHLGIEPLDNRSPREPYFCLEEGRYVASPAETTLPPHLSELLHGYMSPSLPQAPLAERTAIVNALIAYFQLHVSGFRRFTSHEILHAVLR